MHSSAASSARSNRCRTYTVDEFAFRWNTRSALGVEDMERANLLVKGAKGKRLTYRPTNKAQDA